MAVGKAGNSCVHGRTVLVAFESNAPEPSPLQLGTQNAPPSQLQQALCECQEKAESPALSPAALTDASSAHMPAVARGTPGVSSQAGAGFLPPALNSWRRLWAWQHEAVFAGSLSKLAPRLVKPRAGSLWTSLPSADTCEARFGHDVLLVVSGSLPCLIHSGVWINIWGSKGRRGQGEPEGSLERGRLWTRISVVESVWPVCKYEGCKIIQFCSLAIQTNCLKGEVQSRQPGHRGLLQVEKHCSVPNGPRMREPGWAGRGGRASPVPGSARTGSADSRWDTGRGPLRPRKSPGGGVQDFSAGEPSL